MLRKTLSSYATLSQGKYRYARKQHGYSLACILRKTKAFGKDLRTHRGLQNCSVYSRAGKWDPAKFELGSAMSQSLCAIFLLALLNARILASPVTTSCTAEATTTWATLPTLTAFSCSEIEDGQVYGVAPNAQRSSLNVFNRYNVTLRSQRRLCQQPSQTPQCATRPLPCYSLASCPLRSL